MSSPEEGTAPERIPTLDTRTKRTTLWDSRRGQIHLCLVSCKEYEPSRISPLQDKRIEKVCSRSMETRLG
jgi:hypothetical protein